MRTVPARGFAIETLAIKGLRGKGIAGLLKAPLTVGKAVLKARSVMMAHRPAAIQECDTLLVLEDGTRRAFGPRDQVLREMVKNHADITRPSLPAGVR